MAAKCPKPMKVTKWPLHVVGQGDLGGQVSKSRGSEGGVRMYNLWIVLL